MLGGGPQWTSEIWYGPDDTTGAPHGNIGDSCSAMGRIAWFDAKARKVIGDIHSFNTQLGVMQRDLLFYTWMHERYGCDGKMQTNRTAAYFEYPSTVAILLREIRYGIFLSFDHITVDPIDPSQPFSYHIGNVNVDYQPNGTSTVRVPVSGAAGFWRTAGTPSAAQGREFRVHGMVALGRYAVDEAEYTCDAAGGPLARRCLRISSQRDSAARWRGRTALCASGPTPSVAYPSR